MRERGNVWLASAGFVINEKSEWLVVKKKYGGLKGKWSLPAGFVNPGETADEAAIRETREETGVKCQVEGMIGLRTGVIRSEISDNLLVFKLSPQANYTIQVQENEIETAAFLHPDQLMIDENVSIMLQYFLQLSDSPVKPLTNGINPGDHFKYTSYKLFL